MTTTTARVGDGTTVPIVAPIRLLDIDLNQPLQSITPARGKDGAVYRRAQVLVRLHRRPVGRVDLLLDADGSLPAERLAAAIWQALGATIGKHLDSDGAYRYHPADAPAEKPPARDAAPPRGQPKASEAET